MIQNDNELRVTQERIAQFERRLLNIRKTAEPEEFESLAGGYRYEIERMHAEVIEYLTRPLAVSGPAIANRSETVP